jgi:DNA helicase INO80
MLLYWRKNEKDELAARKKADKEALDRAKAEDEARESKRQARKLNFLLTQTELYSHFIGKKIKTNEAEDMEGTGAEIPAAPKGAELLEGEGGAGFGKAGEEIGVGENGEVLPDIDYDDGECWCWGSWAMARVAFGGSEGTCRLAHNRTRT